MSSELISLIIAIVTTIAAIVFCILWYRIKFGKLPETEEELDNALSNMEKAKKLITEVISFFNPEKAMSETSLETIQEVIPATTYKMTEESLNRVLSTCTSEEEKSRISAIVVDYENPKVTGDECCIYELETSTARFLVQYGVPELIEKRETVRLSQSKISEIIEAIGDDQLTFDVMWQILKNEREGKSNYIIYIGETIVKVKDGEYEVEI